MLSEPSADRKSSVAKPKWGNKGRNQRQSTTLCATSLSSNKFFGETKELHGHIYDINTSKQLEMLTNTTKKIANYAGGFQGHQLGHRRVKRCYIHNAC